jgi:hypothetical protein
MATGNLGADFSDCGNYVVAFDHELLLLPCPDNGLHAHGGSRTRAV